MAKDPAFLFYPGDWLGGTLGMTFEEKGAYIELLMLQFNRGHMTKHMMAHTVGHLLDKLLDKFLIDDDGLYYNARLKSEKEKRKSFVTSRNNNKSGNNQWKNKSGHTTSHMEDENISTIVNNISVEKNPEIVEDMIVLEMMKIWMRHNPAYQQVDQNDFPALLQIAYKIAKVKGYARHEVTNGKLESCCQSWEKIVLFIKNDNFYRKLELTTIDRKWTGLVQSMTAEKNPLETKTSPTKVKINLD